MFFLPLRVREAMGAEVQVAPAMIINEPRHFLKFASCEEVILPGPRSCFCGDAEVFAWLLPPKPSDEHEEFPGS